MTDANIKAPTLEIDPARGVLTVRGNGPARELPFGSPEAFELVSAAWLRVGWDVKHVYSFTWMGRPIIQLPEDLIRLQEVIYQVKPDVIVETGVAHGGSLVFHAGLLRAMGRGRVIGVDIEIRPANRRALDDHELRPWITLVEGDSVDPRTVSEVKSLIRRDERVLVILDGCHDRDHVMAELEAYGGLVAEGSYLVACDGIQRDLVGAPRARDDWRSNNPAQAAEDFVREHPEFRLERPAFRFNEGLVRSPVTYWPSAWVRRVARAPAELSPVDLATVV